MQALLGDKQLAVTLVGIAFLPQNAGNTHKIICYIGINIGHQQLFRIAASLIIAHGILHEKAVRMLIQHLGELVYYLLPRSRLQSTVLINSAGNMKNISVH